MLTLTSCEVFQVNFEFQPVSLTLHLNNFLSGAKLDRQITSDRRLLFFAGGEVCWEWGMGVVTVETKSNHAVIMH